MILRLLRLPSPLASRLRTFSLMLLPAILAFAPQFVTKTYIMGILCRILLYITLAGSLNVINRPVHELCPKSV